MSLTPPINFQLYNALETKKLAIVVDIDGVDYLTSTVIGRPIQYGDPVYYGDPDLLYGGLVPIGLNPNERQQKTLLSLDGSSLTIAQRLEPEQGRASVSTIGLTFIDKDQYMTQVITPGFIVPEILGRPVKVWLGYAQTSFPNDFYVIWRGRISQVNPEIGRVSFQFSDANLGKRQQVFYSAKTKLSGSITNSSTTINVDSNGDFHQKILGPLGVYDDTARCYLKIGDEFIEYQQVGFEATGFGVNQFLSVVRGARATTAVAHSDGDDVEAFIALDGHAIDLALKIQLSGWNGPYLSGQALDGFVLTGDPNVPIVANAITLPANIDAVRDVGAFQGDVVTITGSASNDGTYIITGFQDSSGQTNRLIIVDGPLVAESPTPGLLAIRSQFDTLPVSCGAKLPGYEVDVEGHIYYKNTYLNGLENSYSFLLNAPDTAKTFIETEVMLPLGAYCLTRQGKLSMGLTKPNIADARTIQVDRTNVIDPQTIKVQRGINNRKLFNEIQWSYDYDDAGDPTSVRKTLDTDSLNSIGVSMVLPINAKGAKTALGFNLIVERRERFLLLRYAQGAVLLDLKTNFGTGNQIEAGDVILLTDNGGLQIPNMATGSRDYGEQLLEVINRSIDLKTGQVQLQLQGGIGALADDRYATISPSSLVVAGSTTTKVKITESFGAIYPGQEYKKWQDYFGLKIMVHSPDFTTRYDEVTLVSLDPTDLHTLIVTPALSFVPLVDDIVDLAPYSTSTDYLDQAKAKLIHAFLDPSVLVTSGVSTTSFNVGVGDAAKFSAGRSILIHNDDYSILSDEVEVLSIVGTLITTTTSIGFVPAAGQRVEVIGFADWNTTTGNGAAYRFV